MEAFLPLLLKGYESSVCTSQLPQRKSSQVTMECLQFKGLPIPISNRGDGWSIHHWENRIAVRKKVNLEPYPNFLHKINSKLKQKK